MRNEDIWNVYDEDGTLQYTIPKYDKDGCHTRRMAVAVTEQDGRFL